MSKYYLVSVPNPQKIDGGWVCVTAFLSHEEAVEFAQTQFGADEEGRVSLVIEVDDGEEEID